MKSTLLKTFVGGLLLSAASAQASTLLLIKSLGSGYVPEGFEMAKNCQIFDDKIQITRHLAGNTWKEEKVNPLQNLTYVNQFMVAASRAEITREPMPTDIPRMVYFAVVNGQDVTLKTMIGDRTFEENQAYETYPLVRILDELCF